MFVFAQVSPTSPDPCIRRLSTIYASLTLSYCSGITEDTRDRWDSRLSNHPVSSVDTPLWNPWPYEEVVTHCCGVTGYSKQRRPVRCRVQGELLLTVSTPNSNCSCCILLISSFKNICFNIPYKYFQEAQPIHYKKTILLDKCFDVFFFTFKANVMSKVLYLECSSVIYLGPCSNKILLQSRWLFQN